MKVTIEDREYDLCDERDLLEVCDKYHHMETMLFGKTSEDEDMTISIHEDCVVTVVYQNNKWVRKNIYTVDAVEELYEGKWS